MSSTYTGRLAPSPTGALHLGNVRTFMVAYLRARSLGGRLIMRMEDLDHPRDKKGSEKDIIETLRWLGFEWDEEYTQSERKHLYEEALLKLDAYPCVCSRKDVENAQSAPHEGEQLFYSGTCCDRFSSWEDALSYTKREGRVPCWRFRVPENTIVEFDDVFSGHYSQNISEVLGDFPIARDRGGAGYTLAVVVDDAAMGVTEVVRGDDLLAATPSQILLQRKLGYSTPQYCHVPLVVGPDGRRLAKRHGDTRISAYRASGKAPEEIIGFLAHTLGLIPEVARCKLSSLIENFDLNSVPHQKLVIERDFAK